MSQDKWVPSVYLLGSPAQRLALLQGLLDTDGSVNGKGIAEFYSTSAKLAQAVCQIVWSLGGAARLREKAVNVYMHKGRRKEGLLSYTVTLRLPGVRVFRLKRKADRLGILKRRIQPLMVKFTDAGDAECTCISVEHPSQLFQIRDHLVTHNTALQRAARGVFQNTGGTAFIRHGETQCSVEVDFGEDGKVRWEKGTGKRDRPTYVINDGKPIYPGSSVPDEVAAFGVAPIEAGGQDVWPTIAPQFSGQIFLLDRPGSALAEAVADVERVGQLNRALRKSESDKRQAAVALKVRLADLVEHQAEADKFDGLDDAVESVYALEATQKKVLTIARAITGLADLRGRLMTAQGDVDRLAPVADIHVPKESVARDMAADLAELGQLKDLRDRLGVARDGVVKFTPAASIVIPSEDTAKNLLAEMEALQDLKVRYDAAKAEEAKYGGVGRVLVDVDDAPTRRVLSALDVLSSLQRGLKAARENEVQVREELEQAEQLLEVASVAADAVLAELGQCPVCGTIMQGQS